MARMDELIVGNKYIFVCDDDEGDKGTRRGDILTLKKLYDNGSPHIFIRDSDGAEFHLWRTRVQPIKGENMNTFFNREDGQPQEVAGTKYKVISLDGEDDSRLKIGDTVVLNHNDNSSCPYFDVLDANGKKKQSSLCIYWSNLEPLFQRFDNHERNIKGMKEVLEMHVKAVVTNTSYHSIRSEGDGRCRLCIQNYDEYSHADCNTCVWMFMTSASCNSGNYEDSPKRIKELLDWIKAFEEDMKLPKRPKPFEPFDITIRVNSDVQARALWGLLNVSLDVIREKAHSGNRDSIFRSEHADKVRSEDNSELWGQVDDQLRERGFK